jgi:hypothetical protein
MDGNSFFLLSLGVMDMLMVFLRLFVFSLLLVVGILGLLSLSLPPFGVL